eukprot:m.125619 g.125619  ORF g.125619 m.125619 type:complete len:117 (-) comp17333_c0_seq1:701-1051(-)
MRASLGEKTTQYLRGRIDVFLEANCCEAAWNVQSSFPHCQLGREDLRGCAVVNICCNKLLHRNVVGVCLKKIMTDVQKQSYSPFTASIRFYSIISLMSDLKNAVTFLSIRPLKLLH